MIYTLEIFNSKNTAMSKDIKAVDIEHAKKIACEYSLKNACKVDLMQGENFFEYRNGEWWSEGMIII